MIQVGIPVLIGLCFFTFLWVLEILRNIQKPEHFYMKVYLVLRSKGDPSNTQKQWLLERFERFRIIPRVGDTLHLENGQYPVVTEVQLRTDTTCTVWCDVDIPETELERFAAEFKEHNGWRNNTPEPMFHHLVYRSTLSGRKGHGFDDEDRTKRE